MLQSYRWRSARQTSRPIWKTFNVWNRVGLYPSKSVSPCIIFDWFVSLQKSLTWVVSLKVICLPDFGAVFPHSNCDWGYNDLFDKRRVCTCNWSLAFCNSNPFWCALKLWISCKVVSFFVSLGSCVLFNTDFSLVQWLEMQSPKCSRVQAQIGDTMLQVWLVVGKISAL